MPGLLSNADWVFNLRDCARDSDSDEDAANMKRSSDSDLLKTMDLSSREDTAHYKPNPWAIAKLNAACRPPPVHSEKKIRTDVSQSKKEQKPEQITIAQAFSTQNTQRDPSSKASVTSRKFIRTFKPSKVNHERAGKSETQLSQLPHSQAQGSHITSAPAVPVKRHLAMSMVPPASRSRPKSQADTFGLSRVEAGVPPDASMSPRTVEMKMVCSKMGAVEPLDPKQNSWNVLNARLISASRSDRSLKPDTCPLSRPVSTIKSGVPLSKIVAPPFSFPIDQADDKCQAPDLDAKLLEARLGQPTPDGNLPNISASRSQLRTPSPLLPFCIPSRNVLTAPIRSVPVGHPQTPVATPLSVTKHPSRLQHHTATSSFDEYRMISLAKCPDSHFSPDNNSIHLPVTALNQSSPDDGSGHCTTPNTSGGPAYQTPVVATTSGAYHSQIQHTLATRTFPPTNSPVTPSLPSSPEAPETRTIQSISRHLVPSKQKRTVAAYASVKDPDEEWSTFPSRKRQKPSASGITKTRKFMLPIALPSTNKVNNTPVKTRLTLYKPPPMGNGDPSPTILKLRRVGRGDVKRLSITQSTGSPREDSRVVDVIQPAKENSEQSTLVPTLDSMTRPSESSPPTSPPSSPSPKVIFLLPEIQRTYAATRKAISE